MKITVTKLYQRPSGNSWPEAGNSHEIIFHSSGEQCLHAPASAMAQALPCLYIHCYVRPTPSSRRLNYSPFSSRKPNGEPLGGELCFVSRVNTKRASILSMSFQRNSYGENGPPLALSSNWLKELAKFGAENFLPVALISGVMLGLANPRLGCIADSYRLSKFSTFGIFLISGLTLRSDDIGAAAEAWPVGLFGLASILFFSPFFSKIILLLRLHQQEFVTGLAIFCCMPTTLSSGVALTRLAGGNSALALAMTVLSNLLGILVIPFSISKFIAAGVGISVPVERLLRSLITTLLVPLILGKIFREMFRGLADFVDANRKALAVTSAILLSLVPWIQVSRSRSLLLMVKPATFLVAVIMGGLLHALLLCFNSSAVPALALISGGSKSPFAKEENATALTLVASQKTLPVTIAVVEQLGGALGESGLLVLPCVAAHLIQIIIDSFLVNLWKRKEGKLGSTKVT